MFLRNLVSSRVHGKGGSPRGVLLLQLLDVGALEGLLLSLGCLVSGARLGAGSRRLVAGLSLCGLLLGRLGDGLGSRSSHDEGTGAETKVKSCSQPQ